MAAISETLRQARLRSGADLDNLAAKTKINSRYLRAIEAGEFDKLPSGIFARMFVKQYADALGLDGASFADEFQRTSEFGNYAPPSMETIADTRTNFHPNVRGFSTLRDRSERLTGALSALIWMVAAILVCAAVYYVLMHFPAREAGAASPTVVVKAPSAPRRSAPSEQTSRQQAPAAQPDGSTVTPGVKPDNVPETASAPATPPPPSAMPIQVMMKATEVVWVTAIADGKTVVSEALQPGASKVVEAEKGARITLGNAGGVEITFNGKKLEPFGPSGQVRTIDFTSWGAQVVSRTPPSPDPLF